MEAKEKPFSVALIGADGAGKTTIARRLEQCITELPLRYLYMGANVESSNITLPVPSFVHRASRAMHRAATPQQTGTAPQERFWWGWFLKHVAEEIYRQAVSRRYRRQGYTVIYDRHFQFDFAPVITGHSGGFWQRLHAWFLAHSYPHPDLVLFLDAPAEVLFSRKNEATLDYLNVRRRAFLDLAESTPNFVRVNANRDLEDVYKEVAQLILDFSRRRRTGSRRMAQWFSATAR